MSDQGPSRADELTEQREFLLGSLRDLEREHDAGEIDDADYRNLHDDYTARAAAVLRELEGLEKESPAGDAVRGRVHHSRSAGGRGERTGKTRTAEASGRKGSRISPGVYVAAVVAAVVVGAGIGVVAFSESGPSGPSGSGGQATPAPTNPRLEEAHRLDTENKAVEALRAYDEVITRDPNNVEALSYRAWLLARASQGNAQSPAPPEQQELLDRAMASLDRAVAIDPRYPDARFFRGMILFRYRNQPAAAIPEFEAFLANNPPPDFAESVRSVLEQAREAAAAAPPPPG